MAISPINYYLFSPENLELSPTAIKQAQTVKIAKVAILAIGIVLTILNICLNLNTVNYSLAYGLAIPGSFCILAAITWSIIDYVRAKKHIAINLRNTSVTNLSSRGYDNLIKQFPYIQKLKIQTSDVAWVGQNQAAARHFVWNGDQSSGVDYIYDRTWQSWICS